MQAHGMLIGLGSSDCVGIWRRCSDLIDGFVEAYAHEEVGGCNGLFRVRMRIAEVAEELLEFFLVTAQLCQSACPEHRI